MENFRTKLNASLKEAQKLVKKYAKNRNLTKELLKMRREDLLNEQARFSCK